MNILKNNTYYFMKLITVCELIILLMSRDIKTRYNGNLLNYMMVLAVPSYSLANYRNSVF